MKRLYALFICALLTMMGTVSAQDYYIIGSNVNGRYWELSAPDCKFTPLGSGRYEWTGEVLGAGFKINDGTWDDPYVNFGSNEHELEIGKPYSYCVGELADNIQIKTYTSVRNPKVILDIYNETITVTGDPEGAYSYQWYISGLNGNVDMNEKSIMVPVAGRKDVYVLKNVEINGTGTFKISYDGLTEQYGTYDGYYITDRDNVAYLQRCPVDTGGVPYELNGIYDVEWNASDCYVTFTRIGDISVLPGPVDPIDPGNYPYVSSPGNECLANVSWAAPILLDKESISDLQDKGVSVTDMTVNYEMGRNLYIWENTFYGYDTYDYDCVSLEVANQGWSGAGFNIAYPGVNLSQINDDTHLHFSYRTPSGYAPESIGILLMDGYRNSDNHDVVKPLRFAVGEPFNDGSGITFPSIGPKASEEWIGIDITIGQLKQLWPDADINNLSYFDGNIFSFLAGGLAHSTLELKNIYFYNEKKNTPGVDFYITGRNVNGNDWAQGEPDARFEYVGNGIYEWHGETLGPDFKINAGSWEHEEYTFGSADPNIKLILGEPYPLVRGGGTCNVTIDGIIALNNPVVILNTNDLTVTVSGDVVSAVGWYLVGSFTDWEFNKEFRLLDDGKFIVENVMIKYDEKAPVESFKISRNDWTVQYGLENYTNEAVITADNLSAYLGGYCNYNVGINTTVENCTLTLDGVYDVIWNLETRIVSFVPKGGDIPDKPFESENYAQLTVNTVNGMGVVNRVPHYAETFVKFNLDEYWTVAKAEINGKAVDTNGLDDGLELKMNRDMIVDVEIAYREELEWIDELTGVATFENSSLTINVKNNSIVINGIEKGDEIVLYNLSGQIVGRYTAESEHVSVKPVSGIYVLRVKDNAVKVTIV